MTCGVTVARTTDAQSGPTMNAATTYVRNTQLTKSKIFSMRAKLPLMVMSQITSAVSGTEIVVGTPKSARPLAMPANSDIVTAVLAIRSAPIARAERRTPNFSRMSEAKPLPVTHPQRAAVSCTTMSKSAITGSIQSVPYPKDAPALE